MSAPDAQAVTLLAHERSVTRRGEQNPDLGDTNRRAQLERISRAHGEALAAGDPKRAARLIARRDRVTGELRAGANQPVGGGQMGNDRPDGRRDTGPLATRGAFLDAQAKLPARGARDGSGQRRDYASLAPLAGLARAEYEQLGPARQRAARLEIDRELAARREGRTRTRSPGSTTGTGRPSSTDGQDGGSTRPVRRREEPESEVWRDIREVAAGRKKDFGIGLP